MMYRDDEIPWCEFTSLDDRTLPAYVNAMACVGIARADHSGTSITLIGGGVVRVTGDPKSVRKQIDEFLERWEAERHVRAKARDTRVEEMLKAMGQ